MSVCEDVMKKLDPKSAKEEVVLTKKEADLLLEELKQLQKKAELGEVFLQHKRKNLERLIFLAEGELPTGNIASVVKKMDLDELEAYEKHYEKKLAFSDHGKSDQESKGVVQLAPRKKENDLPKDNDVFRI